VRLLAATNRNLTRMMGDKLFRSDLYYRLKVFPISTPLLRDHAEEVPARVRHFTRKYSLRMGRRIDEIPSDTMKALAAWSWPGNVRQRENFIERSAILTNGLSLRKHSPPASRSHRHRAIEREFSLSRKQGGARSGPR
jgi:formate hydrogenlyase transcriptional activator